MRKIFTIYIFFIVASFLVLSSRSLVQLDEVMLLDPCLRWLQGIGYTSKLWFAKGSQDHFLAYLPTNSAFRIPFLYIFPSTLFFHRLPFTVVFLFGGFLIYKITYNKLQNSFLAIFATIFFLSDKGLWDATLSGRSEILQVLLILVYFQLEKEVCTSFESITKGVVIGLLFLTHPPAWIIAFCLLILSYKKHDKSKFYFVLFSVFAIFMIYLIAINFNIREAWSQLFLNGTLAILPNTIWHRITHFYERLLPYPYLYQPWVIVLFIASLFFWLNVSIFKDKFVRKIGILFAVYVFFLLLASENYYRYNPPFLACMYLAFPYLWKYISERSRIRINLYSLSIVVLVLCMTMAIRFYRIIQNSDVNNTEIVIKEFKFVISEQPFPQRSLLIGEPVGYYCAESAAGVDYSTIYTIHKFKKPEYDKIYFITYSSLKEDEYKLIRVLVPGDRRDGTYAGLKLYEMKNNQSLTALN